MFLAKKDKLKIEKNLAIIIKTSSKRMKLIENPFFK
jgi:hypothetical protein